MERTLVTIEERLCIIYQKNTLCTFGGSLLLMACNKLKSFMVKNILSSFYVSRFSTLFSRDPDSMPRVWTGKEDIKAITKTARSAVLLNI